MPPKSSPECIKNRIKFASIFSSIFSSIFTSKIYTKCLQKGRAKFKKIRLSAAGGALGSPRRPGGHQFGQNIAQRAPKAPKMLPRKHPKVEKWRPRHPQSSQNAAQKTARTAKMEPKSPQGYQNAAQETPKSGKMETKASPELSKCNFRNEHRGIHGL